MKILKNDLVKNGMNKGIFEISINCWDDFNTIICDDLINYNHYIWRGQMCAKWKLESSFQRILEKNGIDKNTGIKLLNKHLNNFIYSTRGRRGKNPVKLENDDDWLAIGQHHGLATPLLDWTTSPFVALFFAFIDECDDCNNKRAIYALHQHEYEKKIKELQKNNIPEDDLIKFCNPFSDENLRLVNQSGLFTKIPIGTNIDEWTNQYFEEKCKKVVLLKILIPETERITFLKSLNRMNINHLTLFPDLIGSSSYCNTALSISYY